MDQLPQNFTRRDIIIGMLTSVGALSTVGCAQKMEASIERQQAANKLGSTQNLSFYDDSEFALIERLSAIIIPATETPGAVDVGVPFLMDQLHAIWASSSRKAEHRKALGAIQANLTAIAEEDFLNATEANQISALKTLDTRAFSNKSSGLGNYRYVKDLISRCYYATEPGATQELRYERVPGKWEPCIPFEDVGRTWYK